MKALVFSDEAGLQLQTARSAPLKEDEAVIAVKYAGICSTVHLLSAYPFRGEDKYRKKELYDLWDALQEYELGSFARKSLTSPFPVCFSVTAVGSGDPQGLCAGI